MDLDAKVVMLFRVFTAYESFDAPKAVSKSRALYAQDSSYFQYPLKFQVHDRILVPLENLTYDCPVGINERTGEVGNLCMDHVTAGDPDIHRFRIHGVFKEYGPAEALESNLSSLNDNQSPPTCLYGPRWQYHYGDPFLLRPFFPQVNSSKQGKEVVQNIHVFNLRTGEPLTVPLSKVRLHPNYKFKVSNVRISKPGVEGSITAPFCGGQLLTVAVLGGRNVRLGGKVNSSLLFCLATASGTPSWVLENQLESLDEDFMTFANQACDWRVSDMDDEIRGNLQNLHLGDVHAHAMYSNTKAEVERPNRRLADYQPNRGYNEDDSDFEDAPCDDGDDYQEDGDIQNRGSISPAPSYRRSDRGISENHSRGSNAPLRVSRHSRVRAALVAGTQSIRISSSPHAQVDSPNASTRRGRNPLPRAQQQTLSENRVISSRTSNWSNLAPPPEHFDFLGDRLMEERDRLQGIEYARYHSRERELDEDELDPRSTPDTYAENISDRRSKSRTYEPADMDHSNS